MGREAMIRADMESVGTYSPIFEGTIRQLAKTERELSRAEKTWRENGGQMVSELVNKTGGKYTAKDPHYAVVDQLRKDVQALRNQLGLTPTSLRRAKQEASHNQGKSRLDELLEEAHDYALEHAAAYQAEVDAYVEACISGEANVCVEIRQACERYLRDIQNPKWEFRTGPANEIIAIVETTICHQQGEFLDATPLRGTPFYLLPYHKFIVYNIMGFYITVHRSGVSRRLWTLSQERTSRPPLQRPWLGRWDSTRASPGPRFTRWAALSSRRWRGLTSSGTT